jgi:phage terminase small subunit
MAKGDLTFKQRLFIEAYLGKANGNATEAAKVAGYVSPNKQGPALLVNLGIRAAIDARVSVVALTASEVLARLADIACGDTADFITVDAKGYPWLDLRRAKKAKKLGLIKKLTPTKFGMSVELHDPVTALVQLGKYHGLWDGDRAPKDANEGPPKRLIIPDHDDRH